MGALHSWRRSHFLFLTSIFHWWDFITSRPLNCHILMRGYTVGEKCLTNTKSGDKRISAFGRIDQNVTCPCMFDILIKIKNMWKPQTVTITQFEAFTVKTPNLSDEIGKPNHLITVSAILPHKALGDDHHYIYVNVQFIITTTCIFSSSTNDTGFLKCIWTSFSEFLCKTSN